MDTGGPSDLLRQVARRVPDHTALVHGERRLAYRELDHQVSAAALALRATGLRDGDRVALQLRTGVDFAVLFLAVLRAGLIAVPVDPAYTEPETTRLLEDSGAALHLDEPAAAALLERAEPGVDPCLDRADEEVAALLFTSGASGRMKGAMLSTRALRANVDQLASIDPPLLTGDDVLFVPLPLTHIFGLNAGLGVALRVGATLVLADRFDPGATLAVMAAERVTAVLGVPAQYAAWLGHPAMADGFRSVRFAMSGSATLARGVAEGFAAAGVTLHDGYGLTEAAPVVAIGALGSGRRHLVPGAVGRPLPGVEVELRDVDGTLVDDGDPGRLFVRGANLFSGYWPDGVDGPDADGWFGTGDVAVADAAGELHLVGRTTEMVIVNGFNVYPAEVEVVLAADPRVAEVGVVGVPDPATGEAVHAYVVPTPGTRLDPEELRTVAAESLAAFKVPSVITVVPELPHTVTGKIMRWRLAADASS